MLSREKPCSKEVGYRLTRIRLIKPCTTASRETRHDTSDVVLDFSAENSEITRYLLYETIILNRRRLNFNLLLGEILTEEEKKNNLERREIKFLTEISLRSNESNFTSEIRDRKRDLYFIYQEARRSERITNY